MESGASKETIRTEEVVPLAVGNFPLTESPVDVQLTIHINNLINTYHNNKSGLIAMFKDILYNPEKLDTEAGWVRVRQIIGHYGIEACRNWFMLIYGWEFNQKVG